MVTYEKVDVEEGTVDSMITVKVKSTDDQTNEIRVASSATVLDLKTIIAAVAGFPPAQRQRLICSGRLLDDHKTLVESSVIDGVFIHMVPKPVCSDVPQASIDVGNASRGGPIQLPQHIQDMIAVPVSAPAFSYEDEYELAIWRYRARVVSMLMLFYYFMSLLTSFSQLFHPNDARYQGGQFRQMKTDVPLSIIDTTENILGISVALVGLKAAVQDSPLFSKSFASRLSSLAIIHFINLFFWIVAFSRGEIIQMPASIRHAGKTSAQEAQESMQSIIGAMLIVHPILWGTMLSIAFRYHQCLSERHRILNPQPASSDDQLEAIATQV